MTKLGAGLRRIAERARREEQGPAIVVVVLVVVGAGLSLFGQTLLGEAGLGLIAIGGGLFATWIVGDRQRRP